MKMAALARVTTHPLRASVDVTPRSSLGSMRFRNGLLVRVEDVEGAYGWGEIWCNFPPFAPVARARLVDDAIAPLLLGRRFEEAGAARTWLTREVLRMAIHTGEPGAFAQCIAGLDLALVDLIGRRSGKSASEVLGGTASARVPVYASSPNPDDLDAVVDRILSDGHRAIKLKVGYDAERDAREVARVRHRVGPAIDLMLDANQAWDLGQASEAIDRLGAIEIAFFEEPLLATEPSATWAELARRTGAVLAAGENVADDLAFRDLVRSGGVQVVQPDVAKWGGLTGTVAVAREARAPGATVCPHFMGTAIGLAASLHLLAVAGGTGRVELDANPNPLRTELAPLDLRVTDGTLPLPVAPGLGVEPDPQALRRFALDPAA